MGFLRESWRVGPFSRLSSWLSRSASRGRQRRSLGDRVTRLDRTEPTLNQVAPGDSRDTTTPAAMVRLLHAIFCGSALSVDSRQRLQTWMLDAKVGQERLPAGLPGGWRIGHKTGTGPRETNETNDVAIVWPPKRAPILIAAFYAQSRAPQDGRDAVLREVAQIVAAAI
ncbi:MAG: serine hydrolase [Steroidobacteraceae bacterium]